MIRKATKYTDDKTEAHERRRSFVLLYIKYNALPAFFRRIKKQSTAGGRQCFGGYENAMLFFSVRLA
jgi:hypothetical protein